MAIFGDLATINKMVLYIGTQQISLWIRLCIYLCETHGSDVTVYVRARIRKHTLVCACNDIDTSESFCWKHDKVYEVCVTTCQKIVSCTPPFVNYDNGLKDGLLPKSCWISSQIAVYIKLEKEIEMSPNFALFSSYPQTAVYMILVK